MNTKPDNQKSECQQVSEALSAHFDGAADEAEQQLATAHLIHCSSCARMWREWQDLRLLEQRALEPVTTSNRLPLAPVKAPRNLKSVILRKTVGIRVWQRFWPRLLTGMAVPTFAVACWLLIVAPPQQQIVPENITQSNSGTENRIPLSPEKFASTLPGGANKSSSDTVVNTIPKTLPTTAPPSVSVPNRKDNASHSSSQIKSRPVSVIPGSKSSRLTTTSTNTHFAKSTFKPASLSHDSSSEFIIKKSPQISMVAFDHPRNRDVKPVITESAKPQDVFTPKPRITAPPQPENLPTQTPTLVAQIDDDSINPVLDYIAANDLRPKDIRQAVENYRAALLNEGSDL